MNASLILLGGILFNTKPLFEPRLWTERHPGPRREQRHTDSARCSQCKAASTWRPEHCASCRERQKD